MFGARDKPLQILTETMNALYLTEFFQSHLLILLQTFSSVEDKSKVSYKEMTPRQDSLTCQQPAQKMPK